MSLGTGAKWGHLSPREAGVAQGTLSSAEPADSSQSLTAVTYGAMQRQQETTFGTSHLVLLKNPPRKSNTRSSLAAGLFTVLLLKIPFAMQSFNRH